MARKILCHIFYVPGLRFLLSVCLCMQSHWEFLYLPLFVSLILLEHRASFWNILIMLKSIFRKMKNVTLNGNFKKQTKENEQLLHLRKQSKIGYNTMGNFVIEGNS